MSLFISCQKEAVEESSVSTETISKTTPLTSLIKRVAMVDTNKDNIVDKSSFTKINYPYSVLVNDVSISLNSDADLQLVRANLNQHNNDDDIILIHYPITVTLYDYTVQQIQNTAAFNNLIQQCVNSGELTKVYGVNIQYPIIINKYNAVKQKLSSNQINANLDLFNYVKNLNSDADLISIAYPVQIVTQNNIIKNITSNNDFEDKIEYAIDNDNSNPQPVLTFQQIITSGIWRITYLSGEDDNNLEDFRFVFNLNNVVVGTKNSNPFNGVWAYTTQNNFKNLSLNFNNQPLNKVNKNWTIFEYTSNQIRLKNVAGGGNPNEYLYLQKL